MAGDTKLTPYDMGTVASRVTYIVGNAVRKAAAQAKQILFEVAAEELNVSPTGLASAHGCIYVEGFPERRVAISAVPIRRVGKGRPAIGVGSFNPVTTMLDKETGHGKPYGAYVFAAQMAEVEVDTETGEVEIIKISAVHDCGKAINPLLIQGQVEGGVAMGVGYGIMEEMVVENGRVKNPQFTDYLVPTALDVPEIATEHRRTAGADRSLRGQGHRRALAAANCSGHRQCHSECRRGSHPRLAGHAREGPAGFAAETGRVRAFQIFDFRFLILKTKTSGKVNRPSPRSF